MTESRLELARLGRCRSRGVSGRDYKGTQETFGDGGYVHYLDHGGGPSVFAYAKT